MSVPRIVTNNVYIGTSIIVESTGSFHLVHVHVRTSCRHNIRDFVELHREETDPHKVQELVSAGRKNLETLRQLSGLDKYAWHRTDV